MDGSNGHERNPLEEHVAALSADASRTTFFALMNRIERLSGPAVRIGGDGPPSAESVRFFHDPSLAFRAGDVSQVRVGRIRPRPGDSSAEIRLGFRVRTTFLGLTGTTSPLPTAMAEEALLEESAIRSAFLDVFHHRLVSLLYRSVVSFSPAREHRTDASDPWMSRALALAGLRIEDGSLGSLPPGVKLRLLPLLARRPRSARAFHRALELGLRTVLDDPSVEVEIREFAGGTSAVPAMLHAKLGSPATRLGHGTILGSRVRDPASTVEIVIGPVESRTADAFVDGGRGIQVIRALVDTFGQRTLRAKVKLLTHAEAVEPLRLGVGRGRTLGVDAFLGKSRGDVVAMQSELDAAVSARG